MRRTDETVRTVDETVRTVAAINGMTARWAETVTEGTVLSGAGVWPLLAFLADGREVRPAEAV